MSEVKPLLVQLQKAWQKYMAERTQKLQTFRQYMNRWVPIGCQKYTEQVFEAILSEGSSAEESSFGVLLQRLIDELPQQAKTTNDVVKWALDIKKGASMPYVNLTKAYKPWVALEALLPTEPSPKTEQEKKETKP